MEKSRSQADPAVPSTFLFVPSDLPWVTPVPGITVMILTGWQTGVLPAIQTDGGVVQFVGFFSYTRIRSLARSQTYRYPSLPMTRQWGWPPSPEAKLPRSSAVPEPLAVSVEHDHAVVAVSVRDVDAARLSGHRIRVGIDPHVRRLVQQGLAVVRRSICARVATIVRWRVVAHATASDLQQQRAAVVRVLLHDAVSVTGDPDVVLVVDIDAMDTHRHSADGTVARRASVAADRVDGGGPPRRRGARQVRRPGVHHVPLAIEFDDRGGGMCNDGFRRNQVALGAAVA